MYLPRMFREERIEVLHAAMLEIGAFVYSSGDTSLGAKHVVKVPAIDVAATRKKLGLSQDRFAIAFGASPATVRNWEQGRRHPEGPAKVLLQVIDREPEAVLRALHAT